MENTLPPPPSTRPPSARPPSERDDQRIAKLLARAGVASRRDIERMIAERRIAIDGKIVETPATLLTSLRGVTVDGNAVQAAAPARLFRYHKPTGLLTAARDPKGRPTIYDRLPPGLPRVMPVGRLDLNTEGLLLLTTDGELKRQLELPSSKVERSYRARVFGDVSQAQLEELIHGVEIEGVRYGAIDANLERRTGRNGWVEMRLTEGKNREVRRVLEYLGLQVSRLIRTAYGPFVLGDMPAGVVDEIRQHDLVAFRKALKDPPRHREGDRPPRLPAKAGAQGEQRVAQAGGRGAAASGGTAFETDQSRRRGSTGASRRPLHHAASRRGPPPCSGAD
jgi:23S rRNA pseudouridine2605 synthase